MDTTPHEVFQRMQQEWFGHQRSTAAFIGVLTANQGKITLWRECQNRMAIQQALG